MCCQRTLVLFVLVPRSVNPKLHAPTTTIFSIATSHARRPPHTTHIVGPGNGPTSSLADCICCARIRHIAYSKHLREPQSRVVHRTPWSVISKRGEGDSSHFDVVVVVVAHRIRTLCGMTEMDKNARVKIYSLYSDVANAARDC